MLYVYDAWSELDYSGLDVDGNGALELNGTDRVRDTDVTYEQIGGEWWRRTVQKVYATDGDGTATTVTTQDERLTGLWNNSTTLETRTTDVHGNVTTVTTTINTTSHEVTQTVDAPDSATDAVTVTYNGMVQSATSKTGVQTTYGYDGLGRRTTVADPRTGTTTTAYDPVTGRVTGVTDPGSNVTGYGYDAATGRLSSITDPAGTKQYFAYSLRGALLHTWGEGVYPVEYYYDANYGRRTDMQTFRDDTYDFSTATWPDPDLGDGEVTTWAYEPATGLVLSKTDAAGKAVTYTYTDAGRLKTRTWARPDGPNPLVTRVSCRQACMTPSGRPGTVICRQTTTRRTTDATENDRCGQACGRCRTARALGRDYDALKRPVASAGSDAARGEARGMTSVGLAPSRDQTRRSRPRRSGTCRGSARSLTYR